LYLQRSIEVTVFWDATPFLEEHGVSIFYLEDGDSRSV
jgi:hypothetical protein